MVIFDATESLSYTTLYLPTKIQNNLLKLAMYLLSGNLRAEFDISTYDDGIRYYRYFCGTVGCAVGQGPFAGIPKSENQSWVVYTFDEFVDNYDQFDWLFSHLWHNTDNTPEGTAKRILYTLKFGVPNRDRLYRQIHGDMPLIYDKFSVDYLLQQDYHPSCNQYKLNKR